jgi:cell division protein FtsZ
VDEAATRIREEVDQDANIILGATFDEELEGVIRVSVVATGIDKSAADMATAPIAIRPAQTKPVAARPAAVESRPAAAAAIVQPAPEPVRADPVAEAIQQAEAHAAAMSQQPRQPAAAPADDFRPHSKLFQSPPPPQPDLRHVPQHQPAPQQHAPVQAAPQIREIPQQVQAAPQRMPRVEDFPPVVRAELEAKSHPADHEDRGPMGLLKRLTNGLTRREEEPARLQPAQPREPKLRQASPDARRLGGQDAQLYAPRRGQLDDHGRLAVPTQRAHEEDQLEIPAFLRRQAN